MHKFVARHHRNIKQGSYPADVQLAVLYQRRSVCDDPHKQSATLELFQDLDRIGKQLGKVGKSELQLTVNLTDRRGVLPFPILKKSQKVIDVIDIPSVVPASISRLRFPPRPLACRKYFLKEIAVPQKCGRPVCRVSSKSNSTARTLSSPFPITAIRAARVAQNLLLQLDNGVELARGGEFISETGTFLP